MSDETNSETNEKKMSVIILNQYYVPDVASTGHLLYELAENIASQGAHVKVITCRPSYGPKETWQECPRNEENNGVKVHRMFTTRYSKDSIIGRIVNSVTFLLPLAFFHVLPRNKNEVFLYTTNPPYLGFVGGFMSCIRPHKYVVLLHDSYPELAVWVGKIREGGVIDKFWRWCNKIMYRRAKQVIVLSEAAKELVVTNYNPDPDRVHVIPNWANPKELQPKPKEESQFAKEHGLIEPFTLLYSGNLGLYYEFGMLLEGAKLLENENFRLVFTGAGGQRDSIAKKIEELKLTNTLLLPYTPQDAFNDALNGCDGLLVTIAKGIDGISFPSKLYTCLSVGKPIIAFSSPTSELRTKVESNGVGKWIELGDAKGFAQCVREMMDDPEGALAMGAKAREVLETDYSIAVAGKRYFDVLKLGDKGI